MRSIILMCSVLTIFAISLSSANTELYPRGCIYIKGKCFKECPVGTHSYSIACSHKTPEPTCREPNPEPEEAFICDYSACYCDPPTVRDEETEQCVVLSNCSTPVSNPAPAKPEPNVECCGNTKHHIIQ